MTQGSSNYYTYPTPHGPVTIRATRRGICQVVLSDDRLEGSLRASEFTNIAATQIQEYLAGKRLAFDVPLDLQGSPFQRLVWGEVCEIPYGQTRTAADVAQAIDKPGAHRSVGTAIRRNPIAIIVPTHRIELPNSTGKIAKVHSALRAFESARILQA